MNTKGIFQTYNEVFYEIKNLWKIIEQGKKSHPLIDNLLMELGIKINKKTRYIAYQRVSNLRIDPLVKYLDKVEEDLKKQKFKLELPNKLKDKQKVLYRAYFYVQSVYEDLQEQFIEKLEKEKIVNNFDLVLFKGVLNVGKAFNNFFPLWENYITKQNEILDKMFDSDQEKIMNYLREHNLLDTDENGNETDRAYSILRGGKILSYAQAFPKQIQDIIETLKNFADNLKSFDTDIAKKYIKYIQALQKSFGETDIHKLLKMWQDVDKYWMDIDYYIQISHPLEFYDDKYRKAVAPEWDIRVVDDNILNSNVKKNISFMYEKIYEEFDKKTYEQSYNFSKQNFNRVQLYISEPLIYAGSELNQLFSAQVVPNDEYITKQYGKKIFAFPKMVFKEKQKTPLLKITKETLDAQIIEKYKNILNDDKLFYNIYDIETIGHEFGHTLFLTEDTEIVINKTGNFKNIEEFKATSGGLVSYFLTNNKIDNFTESMIVLHIMRVIGLLRYYNLTEIMPYYCESLIHLDIFYKANLLKIKENKVYMDLNTENYNNFKSDYVKTYKKLIKTYLDKKDAGEFLYDYVFFDKEKKYFLPKDGKLKDFVLYYQDLVKNIGNDVV